MHVVLFFSSIRRHTRCALVTRVQTCALPIFYHARNPGDFEFTLVELDETYCEVARRLLPDAEIICGSIFDPAVQDRLSKKSFDCAISNPPYGSKNVASGKGPRYSGEIGRAHV